MTTAQITAAAATITELLELTAGPLEPTSTPITTELVGNLEITLHAVRRGTGDDVRVCVAINERGERVSVNESHYEPDYGMTDWRTIDTALDTIEDAVA